MNGNLLKIIALCISAAMVCASLRTAHPEIATAISLAGGIAVLMLSIADLSLLPDAFKKLESYAKLEGQSLSMLKVCVVAMLAEFASDICRDAGEASLSRRIDVSMRIGIAAASLPMLAEIMEKIAGLLK